MVFLKKMGLSTVTFRQELRQLLRPYYFINILLSVAFLGLKLTWPVCEWVFGQDNPENCQLDMRENEILFFLLIVIMIRARKTGSTRMVSYLSSGFVYAKVANLVLFSRADPRYGLLYLLLFTLQGMLLPEPTYKGPENITYFRSDGLDEELKRDLHVTWLVTFYAAWSPASINFSPVFAKISSQYGLPNLKFGKIDIGRYPDIGTEHLINTSALTRQLPTVIMFQNGKEVGRVPAIVSGKVQKFVFKEEDIIGVFDLNNLYAECKKDKKYAAQIKQMEEETQVTQEAKKTQ